MLPVCYIPWLRISIQVAHFVFYQTRRTHNYLERTLPLSHLAALLCGKNSLL